MNGRLTVSLKSAWAADGDTKVTLAINPALVGTYNALHGTDYSLLTSASLKQSTIMIKQGKTTPEESVALSFRMIWLLCNWVLTMLFQ